MQLNELAKGVSRIPESHREAVLNIIEHKIEHDMKEVINEIKLQNQKFDGMKNEIKIVYWVIGIAMTILLVIIALKK